MKKILGFVFVVLSLLFVSACSNNSSTQSNNELEGEYYETINDYDKELSEDVSIKVKDTTLTEYHVGSKYIFSIDDQKKTLTGDGKVYSYTYEDGKLTTDISGNMIEYYKKGSKAYKELVK